MEKKEEVGEVTRVQDNDGFSSAELLGWWISYRRCNMCIFPC